MQDETLIVLNVVAYLLLAGGLIVFLRSAPRVQVNSFRALGELLRARFPDLPPGFTLREGLARARRSQPGLDWDEIERELGAYEGYRYGGLPDSGSPGPALAKLVSSLRGSSR